MNIRTHRPGRIARSYTMIRLILFLMILLFGISPLDVCYVSASDSELDSPGADASEWSMEETRTDYSRPERFTTMGGGVCQHDDVYVYSLPYDYSLIQGVFHRHETFLVLSVCGDWVQIIHKGDVGYIPLADVVLYDELGGSFMSARTSDMTIRISGVRANELLVSYPESPSGPQYVDSTEIDFPIIDHSDGITADEYLNSYTTTASRIWMYLKQKGLSDIAASAILGNMYAESMVRENNLQDRFEYILGLDDEEYTEVVDKKSYSSSEFAQDEAGYGLCQWTTYDRKLGLYNLAAERKVSISDMTVQLDYLWYELTDPFDYVLNCLNMPLSVKQASDLFMTLYEMPDIQNDEERNARYSYSLAFYEAYQGNLCCSVLPSARTDAFGPVKIYTV